MRRIEALVRSPPMALLVFLSLSSVWLLGVLLLELKRVSLEGERHPLGDVGAFAATWPFSSAGRLARRLRAWTAVWLVGGGAILAAATWLARRAERG